MAVTPIRTLYIIPRQHQDLYAYLRDRFANDPAVEVILDRRLAPVASDTRGSRDERRRHPEVDAELECRSHAILTLSPEPTA